MKILKLPTLLLLSILLYGCPSTTGQLSPFKQNKNAEVEKIQSEIKALGGVPMSESEFKTKKRVDNDKYIIALRKQLDDLKKEKEEKKVVVKKEKEKKKNNEDRSKIIQGIKQEIIKMGETPMLEFEVANEDKYIAALRKQLQEIRRIKKEQEEKIIAKEKKEIPDWFMKPPVSSETVMYSIGTSVTDNLQYTINNAKNQAILDLAKRIGDRVNSKVKEAVKQAGIGEDLTTNTSIKTISSFVVKDVSISGWDMIESKMVPLDNGKYRVFVLIKYPIPKAYKNLLDMINTDKNLSPMVVKKLKDTETFKELSKSVNAFSGS